MKKTRVFLWCTVLLEFTGCTQSTETLSSVQKLIPFIGSGWVGANYSATFQVAKVVVTDVDSTTGSYEAANAFLWDTVHSVPTDGGTVTMNGTTITKIDESKFSSGTIYQLQSTAGDVVPIKFNNTSFTIKASGSASFALCRMRLSTPIVRLM